MIVCEPIALSSTDCLESDFKKRFMFMLHESIVYLKASDYFILMLGDDHSTMVIQRVVWGVYIYVLCHACECACHHFCRHNCVTKIKYMEHDFLCSYISIV